MLGLDNLQYLQVFLDESLENTQLLNKVCLKMEQSSPEDNDFATLFRAAHTLKGMSATMGFTGMASLTHHLEDVLGHLRQHPEQMTSAFVDTVFSCIDALESALEEIRDTGAEGTTNHADLIGQLQFVLGGSSESAQAQVAATGALAEVPVVFDVDLDLSDMFQACQDRGLILGFLRVDLDETCVMKGPRAVMIGNAIDRHGECLQCKPGADEMEQGQFSGPLQFLLALHSNEKDLVEEVAGISEVTHVEFAMYNPDAAAQSPAVSVGSQPGSKPVQSSSSQKVVAKPERQEKMDRTLRVPVERLDSLMNLLSELVIDKTRLVELAQQSEFANLKDVSDHIARISNELQSAVMSLRMVPIDMLFQRFPRLVRDLSKSLNKDIHLEMSGMDTEFDRTIIDEMGEALVHLIRNSADHGLESTSDRVKHGKSKTGTIELRAYASGQSVFIEVADDGAGVNVERVRSRAVERGIITQAVADGLTDQQVYELLFASGFSTAETISDISGRGVGLDAVKSKVESLSGRVEIQSSKGQGTTFRIQLPLTMSILQALMVVIDGDVFAIPLGSVEEVVLASDEQLEQVQGQTVLNDRDHLIPILDAGDWMYGKPSLGEKPWQLVICKEGSKRVAIAVHELLGQQEVVNKSLGDYLKSNGWFSGGAILGDGSIALIVDTHALMSV